MKRREGEEDPTRLSRLLASWPLRLLSPLALLLGCSGEPRAGTFVQMIDNAFSASVTRAPVGARVIFLNVGGNLHNARASDSSWKTAADIKSGGEETVVFDRPGVYPYYCTYHGTKDGKGMAGVVVVGDAVSRRGPRGPGRGGGRDRCRPKGSRGLPHDSVRGGRRRSG